MDVVAPHARRDVGAIRRLVAREAEVAVDAGDMRLVRIGAELGDKELHRVPAGPLVALLVGQEPHALVVALQIAKELNGLAGKTRELRGHVGWTSRPR